MKRLIVACLALMSPAYGSPGEGPLTVGWRGDGSGRYPDAHPPITWSRNDKGERKNILWETKLPCYSWATPIIVGEKIYVRSEPYDLICLNKKDGKIEWIRSHGPQVAITEEEKKATPAFRDVDPLLAKLKEVNDAYVARGSSPELLKLKHDLQHQIDDLLSKADRKYRLPRDMWVESWSGLTGSTPCSDGENIYFTSGAGVTGCFDLKGNLKWRHYQSMAAGWGEHGNPDSPILSGDKFIVADGPRAFNKKTGKEEWCLECKPAGDEFNREQVGMVGFSFNGTDFVIARANVIRVSDGKSFHQLSWIFSAPVVHDDRIFTVHQGGGGYIYKLDALPDGGLKARSMVNGEYNGFRFPLDDPNKQYDPMSCFWTASPLYHDGLVYCLSNWGKLAVFDAKATSPENALVYAKNLPFDFKNPRHRKTYGCGIGASPCLAGRYIYLMDNAGCSLVIEPGREYKQVAKNNLDHIQESGWEEKHWNDHYHEVTLATPVFEGNRMYVRGEQYLYCIDDK
jgi:outer membrane protein assembly factor BamB